MAIVIAEFVPMTVTTSASDSLANTLTLCPAHRQKLFSAGTKALLILGFLPIELVMLACGALWCRSTCVSVLLSTLFIASVALGCVMWLQRGVHFILCESWWGGGWKRYENIADENADSMMEQARNSQMRGILVLVLVFQVYILCAFLMPASACWIALMTGLVVVVALARAHYISVARLDTGQTEKVRAMIERLMRQQNNTSLSLFFHGRTGQRIVIKLDDIFPQGQQDTFWILNPDGTPKHSLSAVSYLDLSSQGSISIGR